MIRCHHPRSTRIDRSGSGPVTTVEMHHVRRRWLIMSGCVWIHCGNMSTGHLLHWLSSAIGERAGWAGGNPVKGKERPKRKGAASVASDSIESELDLVLLGTPFSRSPGRITVFYRPSFLRSSLRRWSHGSAICLPPRAHSSSQQSSCTLRPRAWSHRRPVSDSRLPPVAISPCSATPGILRHNRADRNRPAC
jgi:hypothetical protein